MRRRIRRRWRRLLCRVFDHRQVPTTFSAHVKTPDSEWERVSHPGPPACSRCDAVLGEVSVPMGPAVVRLSGGPDGTIRGSYSLPGTPEVMWVDGMSLEKP